MKENKEMYFWLAWAMVVIAFWYLVFVRGGDILEWMRTANDVFFGKR